MARFLRLCCVLLLSGCSIAAGQSLYNVRGHLPDLRFSLVADDGRHVNERDFRGEAVLLYFGFAGCSAECPVQLGKLADVLRRLGPDAARARVLFVSTDPVRDTPSALHHYLAGFGNPAIVGLTGAPGDIGALARRYRVAWRAGSLVHGNAIYLFGPAGDARMLATAEVPPDAMADAVRSVLPP